MSPSLNSFNTTSLRNGSLPLYLVKISVTGGPGAGGIPKTIYLSDHYGEYGGIGATVFFRGLVQRWMRFEWGRGQISDHRYTIPDAQIVLTPDRFGDIMLGDEMTPSAWKDFLEFMRYWPLENATIEVYLSFADLSAPVASWRKRFTGRVYHIPEISPTRVTVRFRADHTAKIVANERVRKVSHSAIRSVDDGEYCPVLGGVIGFDLDRHFLLGRDDTSAIDASTYFPSMGLNWGAVPYGRLINSIADDGADFTLRVGSAPISSDATPGGGRIVASWPGVSRNHVVLSNVVASDYNDNVDADVTIGVQSEIGHTFAQSGDVHLFAAHIPNAKPNSINSSTKSDWTNPENAADPWDIASYAEAGPGDSQTPLRFEKFQFIEPPVGDDFGGGYGDATIWDDLFVLLHCEGSGGVSDIRLEVGWVTGGADTAFSLFNNVPDGYHIKKIDISTLDWADINIATWGDDEDDFVAVSAQAGDPNVTLKVFLIGFQAAWVPDQEAIHDQGSPAKFFFQGQTSDSGLSDYSPGEVLRRMLADHSGGEIDFTSDFNASSTDYGGFGKFRTAINGSIAYNSGLTGTPGKLAFGEPGEITIGGIIERVQQDTFCRVWRDPTTGKYNIRLKKEDPNPNPNYDGDDLTLRPHNLLTSGDGSDSTIHLAYSDERHVYNAITYEYHYDHFMGKYRLRCKIDNATEGSEDWSGATSSAWEIAAEDAQDNYGTRRELVVRSKSVSDPPTAWDATVRMFQILAFPRPVIRFAADFWALQLGQASVFKIDAEMADVITWPGPSTWLGLDNWEDGLWWVTRIRESAYGGIEVEAIDLRTI